MEMRLLWNVPLLHELSDQSIPLFSGRESVKLHIRIETKRSTVRKYMGGVAWTKEEDHLLKKCIQRHGIGKWQRIPLLTGLNRCPKSCRLRWVNYLRPNIRRGSFAEEEVDLIIKLHKLLGNRWSLIAGRLPGRTGNDIKNYWNCHLSKRLLNNPQQNEVEVIKPQLLYKARCAESSSSTSLILQHTLEVDEQEIRMLERDQESKEIPGNGELGTMMCDLPIDFDFEQVRVTEESSSKWDLILDDLNFDKEI